MEEKLISKKELLVRYEISYGALYRWKRMGLIPEEWFIKKATVTGQETFFPADLICQRVELIKNQKSATSLDALAKQLSSDAEKSKALIIDTPFGKKVFYFNEIRSVMIDNGGVMDITDKIKGGRM